MLVGNNIGTVIFMSKEKRPMSRGRKIGIGLAAALVTAAVVGIGVFYCIFFPDPLAKRIAPVDISAGEMSVTGESNVLIAYFSIATSRALGLGSGPEQIAAAWPRGGGGRWPIRPE